LWELTSDRLPPVDSIVGGVHTFGRILLYNTLINAYTGFADVSV